MTDWIKHDSSEPPELAPAALVEFPDIGDISDGYVEHFVERCEVRECPWVPGMSYRHLRDEDGTPYISADGLEPWAEYVATDEEQLRPDQCTQYSVKPESFNAGPECPDTEYGEWDIPAYVDEYRVRGAPETHRHPGDWKESLYRVWRD